jgi:shikimate dehydrogenase
VPARAEPSRCSPTWPTGASRVVGVIGDPVAHSLSPRLHNAAFDALGLDWVSVAFTVRAGDTAAALTGMRALGLAGLSVTMPHKEQAFAAVDDTSEVARRLGAVNCVSWHEGTLVGDSTDGEGLLAALARGAGFDPRAKRCLVIGAGGAARAVILALAEAGATEVVVVNRTAARAEIAAALAGEAGRVGSGADVAAAELIVQATPVGMTGGGGDDLPLDPDALHAGQVVADLVYYPLETPLLAAAKTRGAVTAGGLGMLVHQAALALERWTGLEVPVEAMWSAVQAGPAR